MEETGKPLMATFDHPADLIHRIAYPSFKGPGLKTDSPMSAVPSEDEQGSSGASSLQSLQDSLFHEVEAGAKLGRNPVASFGSLAFPSLVLLTLLLAPLYFTETLPKREVLTKLYLQPPVAAGSSAPGVRALAPVFNSASISIPTRAHTIPETTSSPAPAPVSPIAGIVGGVPGGVAGGVPMGVLSEVVGSMHDVPAPAKTPDPAPVKRIRVASRVVEANLIHDVTPQYPPEAGRARIEGMVVLMAVIGRDGSVKDVRVESGLPMLAQAAIDAVKQWRYKPYMIDGEPVEVDSRITINFTLSAS